MLWLVAKAALFTAVMALALCSCTTEEDDFQPEAVQGFSGEGATVLGQKLPNPFAVDNMRQALDRVKRYNPQIEAHQISATHQYVRFLPSDHSAYDRLKSDTTLALYDHPLDYEILFQGTRYHDPSVSGTRPTYQYAAIRPGYDPPSGVIMEVLEDLYLPDADTSMQKMSRSMGREHEQLAREIEDEAFVLSGIRDDPGGAQGASSWNPAGRVTVWDNRLQQFIPVEGVKVQARRWFTVHEGITDGSGFYRMKSFRKAAHYRIVWERAKFDIRSGTFGQAKTHGPKTKGGWNAQIGRNGIDFYYAHVFRAAMRYYYGDIEGLARPSFRLKYSVFDKKGRHMARNIGNWSVFGINPNILIYRYSSTDGSENDADEIFSTTCHETAHTTHLQTMRGGAVQYCQVAEVIRESWAIGVEWFLTRKEYKERGIANYGDASYPVRVSYPARYGFQYWNRNRSSQLTSLFIDLVDNNNQLGQPFGAYTKGTVNDLVGGYTLATIESGFLNDVYGVSSLADRLKAHKPAGIHDEGIDILLKHF